MKFSEDRDKFRRPIVTYEDKFPGWENGDEYLTSLMYSFKEVENILQVHKDSIILDIGAGRGRFAKELKKLGYNNVYSLDGREHRLQDQNNIDGKLVARIETMPFADDSLDCITANYVFDEEVYNQNHLEMMEEVYRVLKPGGTFYASYHKPTQYPKEFKVLLNGSSILVLQK